MEEHEDLITDPISDDDHDDSFMNELNDIDDLSDLAAKNFD